MGESFPIPLPLNKNNTMETLTIIGLSIVAIIITIGIIRVIFSPYNGFSNLLMEMMLLDWLVSGLAVIFEIFTDLSD
jgi:hypothetical protein